MGAASMNDIKARMRSVGSTMQITKAMELVATSKLRRAKERAEASAAYQKTLTEALAVLSATAAGASSVYSEKRNDGKTLYVVLAGDRGLAGGYNANVFRLCRELFADQGQRAILPVGKKAFEYFEHRGEEILTDSFRVLSLVGVSEAMKIASVITEAYRTGEVSRVELIYTQFVSLMTVIPRRTVLLPFEMPDNGGTVSSDPIADGDPAELLDAVIPQYVGGMLYAAVAESFASECASRRTAMNAASKNAEEMIGDLTLSYNRARQAIITQEITEIVSGAEAL